VECKVEGQIERRAFAHGLPVSGIEKQLITCTSVREKCSVGLVGPSLVGLHPLVCVWVYDGRWPRSVVMGVGRGCMGHIVCLDGFVNTKGLLHMFGSLTALTVCVCVFVSVLEREYVTDYL